MLTEDDKKKIEAYMEENTWLNSENIEEAYQYMKVLVTEKSKLAEYVYQPPSWGPND